jgi:O-antigen/teichoic acid export membrane protein
VILASPSDQSAGLGDLPTTNRLSRSAALFGLGALAGKGAALVTLPVIARLLSSAEFGRLDVLNALIGAALAILILGTDVAATRLYFDGTVEQRRGLLATWYALALCATLPVAVALVVFRSQISQLLFGTAEIATAVALSGVVIFVGMVHAVTLGVLRTIGRPLTFALVEGSALVVNAVLAVILLFVWRMDAASVMLALAVSWLGSAVIGLLVVRRSVFARPRRAYAAPLLRLGVPLVPAAALLFGSDFFNRAFLLGAAGAVEAGYLSIAIRIASVAGLVVTAIQLAWQPHAYSLPRTPEAVRQLGGEARQILVAVAACVGALGLAAPEVVRLLGGPRFDDARPAVALALLGVIGAALFVVASLPSTIAKATPTIATGTIIGVAAAVLCNLLLAQPYGAAGTAAAVTSGQFVGVAAVVVLGRFHRLLPVGWMRILIVVVLSSLAVAIGLVAAGSIGWRLAAGAAFGVGLWVEGTVRTLVHPGNALVPRR